MTREKLDEWKKAVYFMWTTRSSMTIVIIVSLFSLWDRTNTKLNIAGLSSALLSLLLCYLAITSFANYNRLSTTGVKAFVGKKRMKRVLNSFTEHEAYSFIENALSTTHKFSEFFSGILFVVSLILFIINCFLYL